ncbi:secreted protein [Plakobranchus ocellatus]|uniref:Secreted protein n=1 Tax=Plakobranchus ocellatus TaxID=259542 RepID=A0AAV4CCD2_9GAST|nr:secreted protein [Plakobranchus ocellatus]
MNCSKTLLPTTRDSSVGRAEDCSEYIKHQHGVGCYECHSLNGSDVHCGDPFHPAYNVKRYSPRCEQAIGNRVGKFPARYCTKIKGTNLETNEEMIVRSCSLYTLDNTCGLFKFENTRYSGCLMSCNRDACNGQPQLKAGRSTGHMAVIFASLVISTRQVFKLGLS